MIYNQEIDGGFLNGLVVGCVLLFIHWLWLFIHSICRWNCHHFLLDIASHNHNSFVSVISEKNEVSLCYHTIKFVESKFFFGMIWITNNEKKNPNLIRPRLQLLTVFIWFKLFQLVSATIWTLNVFLYGFYVERSLMRELSICQM